MSLKQVLAHPLVYRMWQAPFVGKKIAPVLASSSLSSSSSVLDVGCGPGTNARMFGQVQRYVGIDISESYIAYARDHFRGEFRVVDVTEAQVDEIGSFDLILMNSLMHHIDDRGADRLLWSVGGLLAAGGEVHIVDLVLASGGLERRMALADRGQFPRKMEQWVSLVSRRLRLLEASSFHVGIGPLNLWRLVHMRAAAPISSRRSEESVAIATTTRVERPERG